MPLPPLPLPGVPDLDLRQSVVMLLARNEVLEARVGFLEEQRRLLEASIPLRIDAARNEQMRGFMDLLAEGRALYQQVQALTEKAAG